jgi:transposase
MVWGAIWLDRRGRPKRSPLVIMERDPNAPRGGYSSQSYIKTLEEGLLPTYQQSELFMQDNARIHTSRAVVDFLEQHNITTIDWPPYSPDLNPIEHLWWRLKSMMYKLYPQFNNYRTAQEHWAEFCEALKQCWMRIPSALISTLLKSMPNRLHACRKAKGRQTKY